jgi:hypothetical protein
LLKFFSDLSKFICAQLNFVTAQLAVLHNSEKSHAQIELVGGSNKEEIFPHKIPNRVTEKIGCAQGYSAFDTE